MNGPSVLEDEQRGGRAALSGAGTSTGTGTNGGPGRHTGNRAKPRAKAKPPSGRPMRLSLSNWPVATRLVAVFAIASVTGLVFGGLRVSDAISTADELGRTAQLATLGEQITSLAQALEDERDVTSGVAAYNVLQSNALGGNAAVSVTGPIKAALQKQTATLNAAEKVTDTQSQQTRTLAAAIGTAFPVSVQDKAASVVQAIDSIPGLRSQVGGLPAGQVISTYTNSIDSLFQLNDEITSGSGDAALADDVRALNGISRAKDEASQQRAILFSTLLEITVNDKNNGNDLSGNALSDSGGITTLTTALGLQNADVTNFEDAATQDQSNAYAATVGGQQDFEVQTIVGAVALNQDPRVLFEPVNGHQSDGFDRATLAATWYSDSTAMIGQLRAIESRIAAQTVARTHSLQQQAINSAILTAAVTAGAVILVLLATALVGRTLVNPLRRLQSDALEIATKRLPERVAAAAAGTDAPETTNKIEPIGVQSTDEIGRVARAFDQVHAEAVRLAGNEAQLRGSLNAMFISLSRRSVPLIERLSRMIDSMEQSEDDPDQLANLFSMDHMVTRMRRNSENLLVLAGEEPVRKWTEPVPLSDVARAAAAEIEQYNRVALAVQPGIMVSGQAAADVVHLLAELIENATLFSPQSSQVRVTVMELNSGGVLIEVRDDGVGISASRLSDMNWRLDHPPVVDVSISRHMGLYAVSRLAARHGIRVKLRPGTPQGLSALVWLPGHLATNEPVPPGSTHPRPTDLGRVPAEQLLGSARHGTGRHHRSGLATSGEQPALAGRGTPAGRPGTVWFTAKRPSGGPVKSPAEITAGWQSMPNGRATAAGLAGTGLAGTGPRTAGDFAAASEPAGQTTSGLPQRVPGRNSFPSTDTPGAGIPVPAAAAPLLGAPPKTPDGQHDQAPPRRRSAEVARSRLSGFQLGNRDATQPGQGASWEQHAGEENGR
jgi:signal transduction histidine kinase